MLRSRLGDETFFRGIRAYYEAHKNSTATTEDLRAALERTARISLRDFFARWVYGSGHPVYAPSWTWRGRGPKGGILTINLRQTQTEAAFADPLPVEIMTPDGKTRTVIKPLGKAMSKSVPLSQRPTAVRFDPDDTILKEMLPVVSQ
jgi:aminopeptidase N